MQQLTSQLDNRESRLNIRASYYQKEIITKAARIKHTTISNFVLERAYQEAQEILANETNFKLDNIRWEKFCNALDSNPRTIKPLQKLLTETGVFNNA